MKEQQAIIRSTINPSMRAGNRKWPDKWLLLMGISPVSGKINSPKGRNSRTFAPNFEKI